jgi:hypothetical protein
MIEVKLPRLSTWKAVLPVPVTYKYIYSYVDKHFSLSLTLRTLYSISIRSLLDHAGEGGVLVNPLASD